MRADYQSIPNEGQGIGLSMNDPQARITRLEEMLTHLQRTISDLDQAVLDQHRQIESLQREMARLTSELRHYRSAVEIRRPEDEIPPHY
jgi:uncharacterized coiled-coil protein SlyX